MGQDSSSRENSQVALESAKREKATENNGDAQWTGQQVRVQADEEDDSEGSMGKSE